jgi:hypothetical protein
MGRLILNERINGKISEKSISKSGVYILQIENENTATSIKKLFFQ